MKKCVTLAAAAFMAVGATSICFADNHESNNLSFKLGLAFPIDNVTKNSAGSNWFAFGFDYDLGTLGVKNNDKNFNTGFKLTFDHYSDNPWGNSVVMINWVAEKENLYWMAGGGLGFVRTPKIGGGSVTNEEACYHFGVGYNYKFGSNPIFAELRFIGSNEDRLNVYGLWLGVRF